MCQKFFGFIFVFCLFQTPMGYGSETSLSVQIHYYGFHNEFLLDAQSSQFVLSQDSPSFGLPACVTTISHAQRRFLQGDCSATYRVKKGSSISIQKISDSKIKISLISKVQDSPEFVEELEAEFIGSNSFQGEIFQHYQIVASQAGANFITRLKSPAPALLEGLNVKFVRTIGGRISISPTKAKMTYPEVIVGLE